jgi:hypothetical protein
VAVTKYLHAGLDVEQALLRRRKQIAARQEIARDGLRVAVEEWPARSKWFPEVVARQRLSRRRLLFGRFAQGLIVCGDDRRLLNL